MTRAMERRVTRLEQAASSDGSDWTLPELERAIDLEERCLAGESLSDDEQAELAKFDAKPSPPMPEKWRGMSVEEMEADLEREEREFDALRRMGER